jgi:hypothetical protein
VLPNKHTSGHEARASAWLTPDGEVERSRSERLRRTFATLPGAGRAGNSMPASATSSPLSARVSARVVGRRTKRRATSRKRRARESRGRWVLVATSRLQRSQMSISLRFVSAFGRSTGQSSRKRATESLTRQVLRDTRRGCSGRPATTVTSRSRRLAWPQGRGGAIEGVLGCCALRSLTGAWCYRPWPCGVRLASETKPAPSVVETSEWIRRSDRERQNS